MKNNLEKWENLRRKYELVHTIGYFISRKMITLWKNGSKRTETLSSIICPRWKPPTNIYWLLKVVVPKVLMSLWYKNYLYFFIKNGAVFSLKTSCAAHTFHCLNRLSSPHEPSMKPWTVIGVPHWPQFLSLKLDCLCYIVGSLWALFRGSYDSSSHFWTVFPLLIFLILTLYVHISNLQYVYLLLYW